MDLPVGVGSLAGMVAPAGDRMRQVPGATAESCGQALLDHALATTRHRPGPGPTRRRAGIIHLVPLHVWIPAETAPEHRTMLPDGVRLHDYPPAGGWPADREHADLLVVTAVEPALDAIQHLNGVRVVQTLSAGVDRIVGRLPGDVTLCDASGVHDVGVAEWVVAAILAVLRRFPAFVEAQGRGRWLEEDDRESVRGDELHGKRVLVLGFGSIGRAVADRLRPFGVEVVGVARRPRAGVRSIDDLPGLLPTADIVVVLLPLTPETRGFVNADVIRRMKPNALLVNAGRGALVDTDALLEALRARRIRAALDVTDPEPLPDGHPLWSAPNVFITPHIAGDVSGERARAWALVAEQVRRVERGEPLRNVVEEGY